jgi:hypothetical protein
MVPKSILMQEPDTIFQMYEERRKKHIKSSLHKMNGLTRPSRNRLGFTTNEFESYLSRGSSSLKIDDSRLSKQQQYNSRMSSLQVKDHSMA